MYILLTQSNTFIIGPVAKLLGYVMEGIFFCTSHIFGITNVGLSIIIFTIIMKALMMPMTISQQKFSKMSSVMNPELQAIAAKYKGKQDQESLLRQNEETRAVYSKYGVKPSAGCLPLLIQFPVLFALYRVVYNIPAYVKSVRNIYDVVVKALTGIPDYTTNEALITLAKANITGYKDGNLENVNKLVDMMNNFDSSEWARFMDAFPALKGNVSVTGSISSIEKMNTFFGNLNLATNPSTYVANYKTYGLITVTIALLIPLLAGLFQYISSKITMAGTQTNTQQVDENSTAGAVMSSMKMMTTIAPVMSIVFCFMFPAFIGIYWVVSSIVTIFSQIFVNKYMEKLDVDVLVEQNLKKINEKRAREGLPPQKITKFVPQAPSKPVLSQEEIRQRETDKEEKIREATEFYKNNEVNPNSLAAKAGMVKKFNEKNNK